RREQSPQRTNPTDEAIYVGKTSPDGKHFAYIAYTEDPGKAQSFHLWVRPASGGPATMLVADSQIYDFWWSADSRRIYFNEFADDSRSSGVWVIAAAGGA